MWESTFKYHLVQKVITVCGQPITRLEVAFKNVLKRKIEAGFGFARNEVKMLTNKTKHSKTSSSLYKVFNDPNWK